MLIHLGATEQILVITEECGIAFHKYNFRGDGLVACVVGENRLGADIAGRTRVRLGNIDDKNKSLAQEVSDELAKLPYLVA